MRKREKLFVVVSLGCINRERKEEREREREREREAVREGDSVCIERDGQTLSNE